MFKLDLEKAEEPEIKLPSVGSSKTWESSRNTSTSALLSMQKLWLSGSQLWKILQEMGMPDHPNASWKICMQVKKQQLELDMEQWTGSKSGKEHVKAVCCHPAYLTYMQSTS